MTTLKVTARGLVTSRKEVLKHLGIQSGGTIVLDIRSNGQAALDAEKPDFAGAAIAHKGHGSEAAPSWSSARRLSGH